MLTLFDIDPVLPQGFSYHPHFITQEEEQLLLDSIGLFDLANMRFHEYEAKRRVMSFGAGWSFTNQQLVQGEPIPTQFHFLVERVARQLSIPGGSVAQFLITEYPVNSVINWHRDAPPFETIAGVSLQSEVIFKLRPHERSEQHRANTIELTVQPRSLYVMTGLAKTSWQHCTAPVKKVRYSLTFRTLRK